MLSLDVTSIAVSFCSSIKSLNLDKEFAIDIGRLNNFSFTDRTINKRKFMFSSLKRTQKIQQAQNKSY